MKNQANINDAVDLLKRLITTPSVSSADMSSPVLLPLSSDIFYRFLLCTDV